MTKPKIYLSLHLALRNLFPEVVDDAYWRCISFQKGNDSVVLGWRIVLETSSLQTRQGETTKDA